MQSITLETTSIVALVIIITTIVFSYFKYREENKKETVLKEKNNPVLEIEEHQYKIPAIVAIIAIIMEQRPFKIKNIVVGKGEEISTWRLFGRQEIMRRRANMQR